MTAQIQQFLATIHISEHDLLLFFSGMITGTLILGGHARRAGGWGYRRYRRWRGGY